MICKGKFKAVAESKRRFHQRDEEAEESTDRGQPSRLLAYHHVQISPDANLLKRKVSNVREVKQLNEKLTPLEEETKMMKQEILQSISERKILLNDIYQQFQVIRSSLHPKDQVIGYKCCKVARTRLDGLPQVLCEDSNPKLVIRHLRANMVTGADPAESSHFSWE